MQWESDPAEHPSKGANGVKLVGLDIAGDPHRVSSWLAEPEDHPLDDVEVTWSAPHGQPGVLAVNFHTPHGVVRI